MRHKRPASSQIGIDLDPNVIETWTQNLAHHCEIIHGDAVNQLQSMSLDADTVIYADPPYLAETRRQARVYRCDYTEHDHIRLLEFLSSLSCKVLLSGYPSKLYENYLADWSVHRFEAKTHVGMREEWVWFNYQMCIRDRRWTMFNKALVMTLVVVSVVLSGLLASRLGSEFIPSLNEGDIALHALRIPGTSLTQAVEMQKELEHTVKGFPQVDNIFSKIGLAEIATDPMPPSVADNYIMLKPRSEWPNPDLSKNELIEQMQEAVAHVPGNNYEFTQPIQMRFNELISGVRSDVAVKVFGDDMEVMNRTAEDISKVLASIEGGEDIKVEQTTGLPILAVNIDRQKIARLGVNVADVQEAVEIGMNGRETGTLFEGDKRFDIVVRLPEETRVDIEAFKRLPIKVASDQVKPVYLQLGEVASIEVAPGANQFSRENGKRNVVITANVRDRDIGSYVAEARQRIEQEVKIPSGYWVNWGGTFEQLQSATNRLKIVVPLALLLVFVLLYAMFNNLKDGLIVFTGIPFALTGGVLMLWLRDIPLSISAGVGFIALSGVAVLNGSVMISFIRQLLDEGKTLDVAIEEGSLSRLRPILITALVASLGFIPMAIATGTGAEVQRPLATVVIGGIWSSTLLTLLVLPLLYRWIHVQRKPFWSSK